MPTPLMEQYSAIKGRHPSEILLFRLGDFYEMFFEDAKIASSVLGIVLTSRSKGEAKIPMAGIPHHSSKSYINRLLKAGHRVAVCEQTEDPEEADGLVDRAVVRVITPGTLLEEGILDEKRNNYLAAVTPDGGLAWVDLSTGTFRLEPVAPTRLFDELVRLSPSETLVPSALEDADFASRVRLAAGGIVTPFHDWTFDRDNAYRTLTEHFEVKNLAGFGCEDAGPAVRAAGAALAYLKETQRGPIRHVTRIERCVADDRLFLDRQTQSALELTETMRGGGREGSLLWVLDRTATAMGARLLRDWVTAPLRSVEAIRARLDAVRELQGRDVQPLLKPICDLERVLAKVGANRANARDLAALHDTLAALAPVRALKFESPLLRALRVGEHADLHGFLAKAIADDPPPVLTEGGLIRAGFDADLDQVRSAARDGKGWLAEFEAREIRRSGISSLKVGYTQVFGYYIEITNVHKERVPADYVRKQTLKNAERYVTPELKEYESTVLGAEERSKKMEVEIFGRVRDRVAEDIPELQATARALAELDALASLARVAMENDYVAPEVDDSTAFDVRDARHPVLEKVLEEKFVPNDVVIESAKILLITGPNMAGKSTYIRQAALLALLAQMGSFVPAKRARIGVVDRIFTRVGSSDEIARGASTFMVEMNETANILNHATERSLIILDEIGRGTSTFDGLSIAWAVAEHIIEQIGA
ncbi:MAG: DNA mismatch repair protein MutS, partial [Planctomycetes bacterium]|nr:DNA mismatch repair protein MutS [Planctomycetota bacterium]